jgi:cell division septation protein DedD
MGFILNLSEGGLCVQAAQEIPADRPLRLQFQSLDSHGWVAAHGKVAWRNESNTLAGIEFVDLSAEARHEVRTWLSFGNSLQALQGDWAEDRSGPEGRAENGKSPPARADQEQDDEEFSTPDPDADQDAKHAVQDTPNPGSPEQTFNESAEATPEVRDKPLIAPLAVALGLLILGIFAAEHLHLFDDLKTLLSRKTLAPVAPVSDSLLLKSAPGTQVPIQPQAQSDQLRQPQQPPPLSPAHPSKASLSEKAVPSPTDGSKFALQVGAMKEEQNATNLVQSLQAKNFPASVSKRPGDRLYKVIVGPYSDSKQLRAAREALEKQGIQSIVTRQRP